MKNSRYLGCNLIVNFELVIRAGQDAHASYLDPGSASYFFQLAIAGACGALYALRRLWLKWRARLTVSARNEKDVPATTDVASK